MRILFMGLLTFSIFCVTNDLEAQEAPSYPHPPTEQDCENFRVTYSNYLKALRDRATACEDQNRQEATFGAQVRIACSPITWPRVCAAEIERSSCAHDGTYGRLLNQCFRETREETNDPSRRALLGAVGPPPAENTALRMARRLVEASKNEDAKLLLKGYDALGKYQKSVETIRAVYDPKLPPEKRIEILAKIGASKIQNPLASNLTDKAIGAAIVSNREAMNALTRELSKFSTQVERAESTAIKNQLGARERETQVAIGKTKRAEQERKEAGGQQCLAKQTDCQSNCAINECVVFCGAQAQLCIASNYDLKDQDQRRRELDEAFETFQSAVNNASNAEAEAEADDASAFLNGFIGGLNAIQQRRNQPAQRGYRSGGGGGRACGPGAEACR